MKWTHLPTAGGLYDQNPALLDDFYTIMGIENRVEKEKHNRELADQKRRANSKQAYRGRGRRGR